MGAGPSTESPAVLQLPDAMADAASNLPEISVSELSGAIKRTVEDAFGYVRVRGEVSGYKGPSGSGHVYFGLKDQSAKIDAVIWKGVFGRMRVRPEEGLELSPPARSPPFRDHRSTSSSSIRWSRRASARCSRSWRSAAAGCRRRGLFDPARKKRLPFMPAVVGVVTSPTGAVIRDIIHRIADRFPLRVWCGRCACKARRARPRWRRPSAVSMPCRKAGRFRDPTC